MKIKKEITDSRQLSFNIHSVIEDGIAKKGTYICLCLGKICYYFLLKTSILSNIEIDNELYPSEYSITYFFKDKDDRDPLAEKIFIYYGRQDSYCDPERHGKWGGHFIFDIPWARKEVTSNVILTRDNKIYCNANKFNITESDVKHLTEVGVTDKNTKKKYRAITHTSEIIIERGPGIFWWLRYLIKGKRYINITVNLVGERGIDYANAIGCRVGKYENALDAFLRICKDRNLAITDWDTGELGILNVRDLHI